MGLFDRRQKLLTVWLAKQVKIVQSNRRQKAAYFVLVAGQNVLRLASVADIYTEKDIADGLVV